MSLYVCVYVCMYAQFVSFHMQTLWALTAHELLAPVLCAPWAWWLVAFQDCVCVG
jgi:hypothetical protein